jgi:flavodoxin
MNEESLKKLVVYYSFEGNTRFIAESIAEGTGADILEMKPKKDLKSNGFMKYFWGGRQVIFKEKPELMEFDKNPEDYDMIFIGTPVWASSYAPALSTFFDMVKLNGKKIALFCCNGGGKGKTFTNMRLALKNNDVIGEIEFKEPLKKSKEESKKRAIQWATEFYQL